MTESEKAAEAWAKEHDGTKSGLWLRPSHIKAFLAGASWERERTSHKSEHMPQDVTEGVVAHRPPCACPFCHAGAHKK